MLSLVIFGAFPQVAIADSSRLQVAVLMLLWLLFSPLFGCRPMVRNVNAACCMMVYSECFKFAETVCHTGRTGCPWLETKGWRNCESGHQSLSIKAHLFHRLHNALFQRLTVANKDHCPAGHIPFAQKRPKTSPLDLCSFRAHSSGEVHNVTSKLEGSDTITSITEDIRDRVMGLAKGQVQHSEETQGGCITGGILLL